AGKISFTLNGDLPLKKAYEPFTSARKRGEIRVQKIRQHDEYQLKKAASLVKKLFNKTFTGSGEKELSELIHQELKKWQELLSAFSHKAQTGHFPGKQAIELGLALVAGLLGQSNSFSLIQRLIKETNALEDFAEHFEDLDDFYNSQFQTWQALSKALNEQFKANRPTLEKDLSAKQALDELERIYRLAAPYDQLKSINPLIDQVQKINSQLVQTKRQVAQAQLNGCIERVQSALTEASAPSDLQNKALHPLQQCKKRIEHTDAIAQLTSEQTDMLSYEDDAYELINRHIEAQRKQDTSNKIAETAVVVPTPKRTVTISHADIMAGQTDNTFIETEDQVEHYIKQLRDKLLTAVRDGDRVRIK
ncbi:MAG: BREX system P-loop protein BrxC, partial [Methylovulum sp.]|nr:BREX system P-loop protein BrxC [Methylovulum sp.]